MIGEFKIEPCVYINRERSPPTSMATSSWTRTETTHGPTFTMITAMGATAWQQRW